MTTWRYIPLIEAPGQVQMAIDYWLLQQHRQGKHPPTLRFYRWSPVAISLGYHQRQYPPHWSSLTWQGKPLELVRRPTGGRAVLHQGDLTYMLVTSGLKGNKVQVYQTLCQFLIHGWRSLGIELSYGGSERGYGHKDNCFATATKADLVTPKGDKMIGSAQLWQKTAILQHGSMSLKPSQELFKEVFKGWFQEGIPLSLTDLNNEQINPIMEALRQAAKDCWQIELVEEELSELEWEEIQQLKPCSRFG